jgi:hypothetical protein
MHMYIYIYITYNSIYHNIQLYYNINLLLKMMCCRWRKYARKHMVFRELMSENPDCHRNDDVADGDTIQENKWFLTDSC